MRVSRLAPDAFEKVLVLSYQRDSAEAHRMMADIGNELDLYTLAEELPDTDDLLDSEDDAPIIRLINAMLTEAIKESLGYSYRNLRAPSADPLSRRRRAAGNSARSGGWPPVNFAHQGDGQPDIAEKRVPQDGRMALRIGGRAIDVRVSTLPSSHGERVVLRLLDKTASTLDLLTLGMPPALLDRVDALIARPHGIITVTGPTGSGKSTTLYAALSRLDARERNIMTIEDPVEYELEGIGQTSQRQSRDDLRPRPARHPAPDPDVVLVGEIRDGETAQIAVQASLTGHWCCRPCTPTARWALFPVYRIWAWNLFTLHLAAGGDVAAAGAPTVPALPSARQADANTARQMAVPVGARLWQPKAVRSVISSAIADAPGSMNCCWLTTACAAIHRGENGSP